MRQIRLSRLMPAKRCNLRLKPLEFSESDAVCRAWQSFDVDLPAGAWHDASPAEESSLEAA